MTQGRQTTCWFPPPCPPVRSAWKDLRLAQDSRVSDIITTSPRYFWQYEAARRRATPRWRTPRLKRDGHTLDGACASRQSAELTLAPCLVGEQSL